MKKLLMLLCIVSAVALAFCGCKEEPPMAENSVIDTLFMQEYEHSAATDLAIPAQSLTVEFENAIYEGTYTHSATEDFGTFVTDYYTMRNGTFGVKHGTQEVVSANITLYEKGDLTAVQCRDLADDYAAKYIDTSKCVVLISDNVDIFNFEYVKYLAGQPTNEILEVGISTGGTVCRFKNNTAVVYNEADYTAEQLQRIRDIFDNSVKTHLDKKFFEAGTEFVECEKTVVKINEELCVLFNYHAHAPKGENVGDTGCMLKVILVK